MNQQTIDLIKSTLDALASKLNTTGAFLWATYVKQARVEAITDAIIAIAFFLVMLGGIWSFRTGVKLDREKPYRTDTDGYFVVGVILAAIGLIVSLVMVTSIPGELLNPDYWAFAHLMKDLMPDR